MKKTAAVITICFFCVISVLFAQSVGQKKEEKIYKIELTTQQANLLLYVLDKSTAEHNIVGQVQADIVKQLQAQQDTVSVKKNK